MRPSTTSDLRLLIHGMRLNAGLSLAQGLIFLLTPVVVEDALNIETEGWLRLFGAALVIHAVLLVATSRTTDPAPWARLNLVVVGPYPLLMVGLVAFVVDRPIGIFLVLLDGLLVGAVALLQYAGLPRGIR